MLNNNKLLKPIKIYKNAELQKKQILKENKNKSGIYLWTNLLSYKKYVGSSKNLRTRLYNYYNNKFLLKKITINKSNSKIYKALLEDGHKNFSLEILEYCDPSIKFIREQYYIDLLNPEYNMRRSSKNQL